MGTFINTLGNLNIPKDKQEAFIADAKIIAEKGGLFSQSYTSIFGSRLWLLSFPSFEESADHTYADFTYSYFEKDSWENAGIDFERTAPYSEKIGWRQFNQAVQALYFLAESYSDEPFISYNDSLNRPEMTIKWLRYALGRDISFPYRRNLWSIYELLAERDLEYYGEIRTTANRVISDFQGDEVDSNSLLDVVIVSNGAEKILKEAESTPSEKPEGTLSYNDFMRIYRNTVIKFKDSSKLNEDHQVEFLLGLFTCEESERDAYRKKEETKLIMFGTALISPVIATKIVSEIYEKDFWELWKTIRNDLTITGAVKLDKDAEDEKHEVLSTEQYFSCSTNDRLYWWGKDNDVVLSEETEKHLCQLAERHKELCGNLPEGDIMSWQKRLVNLLSAHPKIYCFEQMFYEFIGSFHDEHYKAAVLLLEESADNEEEYRRLLAVFANRELRKHIFSF